MSDLSDRGRRASAATSELDYQQRGAGGDRPGKEADWEAVAETFSTAIMGLSTRRDEKWCVEISSSPATTGPTAFWFSVASRYPGNTLFDMVRERFRALVPERLATYFASAGEPRRKILIPPSITIEDADSVIGLLSRHASLDATITEAHSRLSPLFDTTSFVLRSGASPESSDPGDVTVVLAVQTMLSPEDAAKRLDEFDTNWWLDVPAEVRALLTVTLDLV